MPKPSPLLAPFTSPAISRRGLQVYNEICAGCHSLEHVSYRNLLDIGFSNDQVKEFASQFEVTAEPDSDGEVNMRSAIAMFHL